MKIRVILKNGEVIQVACENYLINVDQGNIVNCTFINSTENQILYLNPKDIAAIIRDLTEDQA